MEFSLVIFGAQKYNTIFLVGCSTTLVSWHKSSGVPLAQVLTIRWNEEGVFSPLVGIVYVRLNLDRTMWSCERRKNWAEGHISPVQDV